MTSIFGQGYTHTAPSFSIPNLGFASYTLWYTGRVYTNHNTYEVTYTTVAYADPIPQPGSSVGFLLNSSYHKAMQHNTLGQPEFDGFGYETAPQFLFRPQPIDMMLARATIEPGADPNNSTNQLGMILRESFGIEPKG
jgi:hypothetical protein